MPEEEQKQEGKFDKWAYALGSLELYKLFIGVAIFWIMILGAFIYDPAWAYGLLKQGLAFTWTMVRDWTDNTKYGAMILSLAYVFFTGLNLYLTRKKPGHQIWRFIMALLCGFIYTFIFMIFIFYLWSAFGNIT